MNTLKTILVSAVFLLPIFTYAQGGDDPMPGIDIIMKKPPPYMNSRPPTPISKISLNSAQLKEISALKDEERSVYLSKILPNLINKAANLKLEEKLMQPLFLKQLLANRCNPCRKFETFTIKTQDPRSKQLFVIQFNLHTKVKTEKTLREVSKFKKSKHVSNTKNVLGNPKLSGASLNDDRFYDAKLIEAQ